jgi:heme/copper-type cytochrome/quinol oxidase subunit 2
VTDTGVPLSSTQVKGQNAWALFNLILAIIGIVLALTACIHALVRNTREKREASEGFVPQSERLQRRNRRMLWFVIAVCLGIAGVVVFFLTQDLSSQMVMVDNWTILNAIILVLEIASYVFAFAHSQGTKNTMNPLSVEQNV